MTAGVSAEYSATCRRAGRKGALSRRAKYQPLDYELALLRKFYPDEGVVVWKRLSGRSRDWIKHVAAQFGIKYLGPRQQAKPGTDDPAAIARMAEFLRGRV